MVLRTYFQSLVTDGLLETIEPDRWVVTPAFDQALRTARKTEQLRRDRIDSATARIRRLLSQIDDADTDGFDLELWASKPIGATGLTLDELARSERWDTLTRSLEKIANAIGYAAYVAPDDLLGLPVAKAIQRATDARIAREAAKAEAARLAEIERMQGKVEAIERSARSLMPAALAMPWIDRRRAILLRDEAMHAVAWRELEAIRQAEQLRLEAADRRDDLLADLEAKAKTRLGGLAETWLHSANNGLQGERPWDHCQDPHTLRACLLVLNQTPRPRNRPRLN
jgi:hypothetical protein